MIDHASPAQQAAADGSRVAAAVFGQAVGDALGVPVEFFSREQLEAEPVTGMRGFGTHRQPAGTWSDDTSLTLCLVESLCEAAIDHADQARRFVGWLYEAKWTPHGRVFDVGNATRAAIDRLASGVEPLAGGLTGEGANGNGALMRIMPLALYLAYAPMQERAEAVMKASRLTHGHPRSQIACALYAEIAAGLVRGCEPREAFNLAKSFAASTLLTSHPDEHEHFARLLAPGFESLPYGAIRGSGYVIHTLEASVWCLLNKRSYAECVLAAVNLGEDTDTTGAVAGGLAGLAFGGGAIPDDWLATLARRAEMGQLVERFEEACNERWRMDGATL